MPPLSARIHALLASGQPAALVRITKAKGSTPRDGDALMLVTDTLAAGTIGGVAFTARGQNLSTNGLVLFSGVLIFTLRVI